ncbi:Lrp/AsnC family transcriptional regulator [Herminiimonas arsenitoxidans]|uniref:Lrp/AsnC family transcriptional regulator n=1 Tax=Herminiimonas arsenitoxidans TaxID=1809410 RepID=UPI0009708B6B|nr:Lrp/AsnC family transcriptional regulator [Herminiimonas arsenitoxidans]
MTKMIKPTIKLDETDNAILDLLAQNGRMSNREVGRVLDIAEGTVRQRLKRLLETKAARIGLVTDVAAVGIAASAVLLINTLPEERRHVAARLAKRADCGFVGLTLGRYEMTAFISASTRVELAEILEEINVGIKGITKIEVREPVGWRMHRYDLVHVT